MDLIRRYRKIKQLRFQDGDVRDLWQGQELDKIHNQIVKLPIHSPNDAFVKLQHIRHCLSDEADYKEAENLADQLCAAWPTLWPPQADLT